jgi:hypothetical protein
MLRVRSGSPTREDDRFDALILSKHPDKELCEIIRVYELAEGFSGASYNESSVVL